MSTLPKLDPTKTSWDYIKQANSNDKKIFVSMNKDDSQSKGYSTEPWKRHSVRTKFRSGEDPTWYIRTKEGRKELDKDDVLLQPVVPLYCPKCKKIMKRGDLDNKAFLHTGGCFICHINEHAEKNQEAGIKIFKEKINEFKEVQKKLNDSTESK